MASDEGRRAWPGHTLELGDMLHVTKRKKTRKGKGEEEKIRKQEGRKGERERDWRSSSVPQRLNKDALLKGPRPT